MTRRSLSVRGLIAAALVLVWVQAPGAATGLAFLKNGVDARATMLGHAVTACVEDASACYWNPAGLAGRERPQLLFSHVESFADLRQEYAAVTQPIDGATVGLAFNGLWTDNLEGYDEIGESTGSFGYSAYAASLAAGLPGPWGTRLGVGGTYLNETIGSYSATGWAADIGGQWSPRAGSPLTIGLAARHVGPAMKFVEETFDLPLTIQGGVAWQKRLDRANGSVLIAAEVRHVRDQGTGLLAGVEYSYRELLSLGFGYIGGEDSRDVSAGLGIQHGRFGLNYAFVPVSQEDVGDNEHRFSLRLDL